MLITRPDKLQVFEENLEYLYFLWYKNKIVYIGITNNLTDRISCHRKDKIFDKVTYKEFLDVSRNEMLQIESENIRYYKPVFNNNTAGVLKEKEFFFIRGRGIFDYGVIKENYYCNSEEDSVYYADGNLIYKDDRLHKVYQKNQILKIKENELVYEQEEKNNNQELLIRDVS